MYMILQGVGRFLSQLKPIITTSTMLVELHSAYGLGYDIGSSGKKADNCHLLTDPLFVVCWIGSHSDVRLLVIDGSSVFTSGRVGKHNCHR